MAITTFNSRLYSLVTTKDFGLPNGFGEVYFGWSEFGDWNVHSGTYARVDSKQGKVVCRKRHMWPLNPQTEKQQEVRSKFALAVSAWQNLTNQEKSVYNTLGEQKSLPGYNYFISEYLKNYVE